MIRRLACHQSPWLLALSGTSQLTATEPATERPGRTLPAPGKRIAGRTGNRRTFPDWFPAHPAVTVRFDDFTISGAWVEDEFDDGRIPATWQVQTQPPDASAEESDGKLVLRVPAGLTSEGFESRVDVWPAFQLGDEFDVSVSFSVEDGFYSSQKGAFGLYVEGGGWIVFIGVEGGAYQTWRLVEPDDWLVHPLSETVQLDGKLRITRTYTDG